MGIKNLPLIVGDLIKNGKDKTTPIAIIEKGATADQRVTVGTLENIVEIANSKNSSSSYHNNWRSCKFKRYF